MKIKYIGVASVVAVVLLLIAAEAFGYINFTNEHRVDLYLRNYAINLNLPIRSLTTVNYSSFFNMNAADRNEDKILSMLEQIMPSANHDDILRIYNHINNSDYQYLPDSKTILNDYTIYQTVIINFHGVNLQEGVYSSSGRFHGSPTDTKEVYTFYSHEDKRTPKLVYILFRRLHSTEFDVLPINISKEEFVHYYNSLISDFLDFWKSQTIPGE